jgi:hypothetical protein
MRNGRRDLVENQFQFVGTFSLQRVQQIVFGVGPVDVKSQCRNGSQEDDETKVSAARTLINTAEN